MNEIDWERARELSRQQTQGKQRPMTDIEMALRRQSSLEALAAGALASIIESHPKFNAEQSVNLAFEIAAKVIERAENAREKIKADFQMSE